MTDKIVYRRQSKVKPQDHRFPVIDTHRRVIDFRDDRELFKIVSVLILNRVDLGPVDLGPVPDTGRDRDRAPDNDHQIIDLDALPAGDAAPSSDVAAPAPVRRKRRKLSDQFGLYRHPDRYGAT